MNLAKIGLTGMAVSMGAMIVNHYALTNIDEVCRSHRLDYVLKNVDKVIAKKYIYDGCLVGYSLSLGVAIVGLLKN